MKKAMSLLLIAAVLVSVVSCGTVVVKAPANRNIGLSQVQPANWDKSKMVFYVLWGLVPLGDNSTADMLGDVPDGAKIAVKTETTFVDFLITAFLGVITVTSKTVNVSVIK